MTGIHQKSLSVPNTFCALPVRLPLHPSIPFLANTDLFAMSIAQPFPECHMVGKIQYVAFSDGLLSLRTMPLSSFHVFPWLDSSFLFTTV